MGQSDVLRELKPALFSPVPNGNGSIRGEELNHEEHEAESCKRGRRSAQGKATCLSFIIHSSQEFDGGGEPQAARRHVTQKIFSVRLKAGDVAGSVGQQHELGDVRRMREIIDDVADGIR